MLHFYSNCTSFKTNPFLSTNIILEEIVYVLISNDVLRFARSVLCKFARDKCCRNRKFEMLIAYLWLTESDLSLSYLHAAVR